MTSPKYGLCNVGVLSRNEGAGLCGFASKKEKVSICRERVLRGSSPGEEGEDGKGDRNGDCIGLFSRLELFRAASKMVNDLNTRTIDQPTVELVREDVSTIELRITYRTT